MNRLRRATLSGGQAEFSELSFRERFCLSVDRPLYAGEGQLHEITLKRKKRLHIVEGNS